MAGRDVLTRRDSLTGRETDSATERPPDTIGVPAPTLPLISLTPVPSTGTFAAISSPARFSGGSPMPLVPCPPISRMLMPGAPLDEVLHELDQFGGLEGLGEERVHTHIEAGLHLVLSARADDGEGQVVGTGIGPEQGSGTEAVQPGHDDIERHDVGPHFVHHVQTLDTIGRGHDL
ncbi:hypothetical protein GCM10010501_52280 [Streptomyces libani subsp. rufus]|nr:hypothetical protein GCM10010501_52280 [Streptomyces libani subsp. rufus]